MPVGKLIVDPRKLSLGVPLVISQTCSHNYDGAASAMYAVWQSKPFDPRKLIREADECIRTYSPSILNEWEARLDEVKVWASKFLATAEAEQALRDAAALAKAAGIYRQDANLIVIAVYEAP